MSLCHSNKSVLKERGREAEGREGKEKGEGGNERKERRGRKKEREGKEKEGKKEGILLQISITKKF